jgi:hypothetical protein
MFELPSSKAVNQRKRDEYQIAQWVRPAWFRALFSEGL